MEWGRLDRYSKQDYRDSPDNLILDGYFSMGDKPEPVPGGHYFPIGARFSDSEFSSVSNFEGYESDQAQQQQQGYVNPRDTQAPSHMHPRAPSNHEWHDAVAHYPGTPSLQQTQGFEYQAIMAHSQVQQGSSFLDVSPEPYLPGGCSQDPSMVQSPTYSLNVPGPRPTMTPMTNFPPNFQSWPAQASERMIGHRGKGQLTNHLVDSVSSGTGRSRDETLLYSNNGLFLTQGGATCVDSNPDVSESITTSGGEDEETNGLVLEKYGEADDEQGEEGGDHRQILPMTPIPFEATVQQQPMNDESHQVVPVIIHCEMPRPFGYLVKDGNRKWVAYRRNYFEPIVSIELKPPSSNDQGYLYTDNNSGRKMTVLGLRVRLSGNRDLIEEVEMVVFPPDRKKPIETGEGLGGHGPPPERLRPIGERCMYPKSTGDTGLQTQHKFKRPQFKKATINNGARRSGQTYYHVRIDVEAEVERENGGTEWVSIASCTSAPLIVRGRPPGKFEKKQDGNTFHNRRKDDVKAEPRPEAEKKTKVRKRTAKSRGRQESSRDALPFRLRASYDTADGSRQCPWTGSESSRVQTRTQARQAPMIRHPTIMQSCSGTASAIKMEHDIVAMNDILHYKNHFATFPEQYEHNGSQRGFYRGAQTPMEVRSQYYESVPGPEENAFDTEEENDEPSDDSRDETYGSTHKVGARLRRHGRHH